MGAGGAKEDLLRREEIAELEAESGFDSEQIIDLYVRFRKLDRSRTGTITRADLLNIPELSMNPLVDRVVAHFGFSESARINFNDFLRFLSTFLDPSRAKRNASPSHEQEELRLRQIFAVFDTDHDDHLSEKELHSVLKGMVGTHIDDDELDEIVRRIIVELDELQDGKITADAFCAAFRGSGLSDLFRIKSWARGDA